MCFHIWIRRISVKSATLHWTRTWFLIWPCGHHGERGVVDPLYSRNRETATSTHTEGDWCVLTQFGHFREDKSFGPAWTLTLIPRLGSHAAYSTYICIQIGCCKEFNPTECCLTSSDTWCNETAMGFHLIHILSHTAWYKCTLQIILLACV
jgi:hypothetical protein